MGRRKKAGLQQSAATGEAGAGADTEERQEESTYNQGALQSQQPPQQPSSAAVASSGGGGASSSHHSHSHKRSHADDDAVADNDYEPVSAIAEDERRRGNKEYHKKNFAEAVLHYTRGIALAAHNPVFLVVLFANRAAAHIGLKSFLLCVEDCSAAIKLDPFSVKAHGRRAYAYYCMKAFKESVADYERALQLDPDNTQVQDNLARAHQSLLNQTKLESENQSKGDDGTKGGSDYNSSSGGGTGAEGGGGGTNGGRGEEDGDRSVSASVAHRRRHPFRVVQSPVSNSAPVTNEELPPLFMIEYTADGRVKTEAGRDASAVTAEDRALKEKELGNYAFLAGNFEKALYHYSKAIRLNKTDAVFFSNRAAVYLKLDRYADAISDCTESISLKKTIKAYARRGAAYVALNDYERAREDYKTSLSFEKHNADCRAELGRCLLLLETMYSRGYEETGDERLQEKLYSVRNDMMTYGL